MELERKRIIRETDRYRYMCVCVCVYIYIYIYIYICREYVQQRKRERERICSLEWEGVENEGIAILGVRSVYFPSLPNSAAVKRQ